MTSFRTPIVASFVAAAALSTFVAPARATDFGHHPAATKARAADAEFDPSTFMPGHPARGAAGQAAHANFEHPALATYRAGQLPHTDPNTFIVQPPATTAWIVVDSPTILAMQQR
ncbi:hypothetical protein LRH25_31985 [Ideonella azotifigens]|uniref:RcnB family protein n=1 Tax=Ideonella azotifigens TaxID=513160 RepID=A0ABP3V7T6_9BURK|nr:hypothetical protein [Ideonella azotifigens]MCD2344948.1 hypothetical protein [Ideonella azotifigens]